MENTNKKYLRPQIMNIPHQLKALPQWVLWRIETRNGDGPTKVPYTAFNGRKAKPNDPKTWAKFSAIKTAYKQDKKGYTGIGFVLTNKDSFVGWDLDDCRDPKTGEIQPGAQEIIDRLNSYTEISPSRTGIRIFVKGNLPPGPRRNGIAEVYDDGRYLTLTGHRVKDTPSKIEERQDELLQLYFEKIDNNINSFYSLGSSYFNIDGLIKKALKSKNGNEIRDLLDGNFQNYPSQSEADLDLCIHLAFWLDCKPEAMDTAFRDSKLFRRKWEKRHSQDGRTYGQLTIEKAIMGTTFTYQDRFSAKEGPFVKAIKGRLSRVSQTQNNKLQYRPIASFDIDPLESIYVDDEGEHLRVLLKNGKIKKEIILPPDSWNSLQKFLKILTSKEFTFTGSGTDVQLLRDYTSNLPFQDKKGVRTAGFHNGCFVTEKGAIDKKGPVHDVVLINDINSHCNIIDIEPAQQGDFSIIKEFNNPKIVTPLLGFAAATFFKPQIIKSFKKFPIMIIEGEAGAGKTSTVTEVVMRLWAMENEPHAIGAQSVFTLMKLVNGSNSIPVIFEENKSGAQDDKTKNSISNLIRSSYNNLEGQRGRADQTLVTYYHQAPIIIVGETGFTEPAILDRTVPISMSKKDSAPFKEKFLKLKDLPFENIGRSLLQRSLEMPAEDVEKALNKELKGVSKSLNDRPRFNAAVARFGLRMLSDVTGVGFNLKCIDQAVVENLYMDGPVRKSAVDKIIEKLSLMSGEKDGEPNFPNDHLKRSVHYQIDENTLRLHIACIYPVFRKWAKVFGYDGDLLPENTFKKQLKKEDYYVDKKVARIGEKPQNVFMLNIKKMIEKGLDIGPEWGGGQESEDTEF